MIAAWKSLLGKVRRRGVIFTALFWFFFSFSVIPLLALFIYSTISLQIPTLVISLVLLGIITLEMFSRRLYVLSLILVLFNFVLWFIMGFIVLFQGYFDWLPGFTSYLLLAPYAFVSGGMVKMLLWRASKSHEKTLLGGIIVSVMIALVAATTNIVIQLAARVNEGIHSVENIIGLDWVTSLIGGKFYDPTIGFLLVMVVFNNAFVIDYLRAKHTNNTILLWYLVPVAIYFLFKFIVG